MNCRFEFLLEIHAFSLLLQGSNSPTITNDLLYKSLSDIRLIDVLDRVSRNLPKKRSKNKDFVSFLVSKIIAFFYSPVIHLSLDIPALLPNVPKHKGIFSTDNGEVVLLEVFMEKKAFRSILK